MLLSDLCGGGAAEGIEVLGLTADSREVRPGYLFAALQGGRADGAAYIADAVGRGAVAVLTRSGIPATPQSRPIAIVTDDNPRRRLAEIAARFYPGQPRTIAAVTGTSGKTSVADFTRQIWAAGGHPAASLGTLGVIGEGLAETLPHTTPDPVTLHRALDRIAAAGVDHLAIEASSHGLDQNRMDAVRVTAAAFTNLSRDHLDYHADSAAYLSAKQRLFDTVMAPGGTAVLNADAPEFDDLRALCTGRGHRVVSYGRSASALRLIDARPEAGGQRLVIEIDGARHDILFPLAAEFQALNALCAVGLSGVDGDAAVAALSGLAGVPGRIELVARHPSGADVYVDYAHKPDALDTVLAALRAHATERVVVVFGCGGDRDREKRPMMGRVAASRADRVILTDDNPRSEDAAAIRREALAGCPGATEIADRATAIYAAVASLSAGDVLVIAGKGHEQGQIIGTTVIPFDDAQVARDAVSALGGDVL